MPKYSVETVFRATDKMSGPIGRMEAATGRFSKSAQISFSQVNAGIRDTSLMAIKAGAALTAWPVVMAMATKEIGGALNSLRQVGVKDTAAMQDAAIKFSNQWAGVTAPDFVAAAYDIRSAINLTDKSLVYFTRTNALTAMATKATAEEMKEAFTTGWGIMRQTVAGATDIQFLDRYSAALTATASNFKATGGSMAGGISNLGAQWSKFGFSMESQLAILGRLQATMTGTEAGTVAKNFMAAAIRSQGKLGPAFRKALQKADVIGMMDALNKKFGDQRVAKNAAMVGKALGSIEAVSFVTLLSNTKMLKGDIKGVTDASKQGAAYVTKMAKVVNQGMGAGADRARQQLQNLTLLIGDITAPAVIKLVGRVSDLILASQKWVTQNKDLVRGLSDMSLKWGPLIAGAGAFGLALSFVGGRIAGLLKLIGLIKAATLAAQGLATAQGVGGAVAAGGGAAAPVIAKAVASAAAKKTAIEVGKTAGASAAGIAAAEAAKAAAAKAGLGGFKYAPGAVRNVGGVMRTIGRAGVVAEKVAEKAVIPAGKDIAPKLLARAAPSLGKVLGGASRFLGPVGAGISMYLEMDRLQKEAIKQTEWEMARQRRGYRYEKLTPTPGGKVGKTWNQRQADRALTSRGGGLTIPLPLPTERPKAMPVGMSPEMTSDIHKAILAMQELGNITIIVKNESGETLKSTVTRKSGAFKPKKAA